MIRLMRTIVLVLVGIAIISLSVANRHSVRLVLDPFIDRDVALAIQAPLFLYLFAALIAGVVIGGLTMWAMQGYWRRAARKEQREAAIWRREAENLKKGLQSGVMRAERASPQFPHAFR